MNIRPPAVAGSFYPADPATLQRQIDGFLAAPSAPTFPGTPKALVCPHAGIVYSGKTAGIGYAQLKAARLTIRRVVLLGPTHRVAVRGLAVPTVDALATPLGIIPIDAPLRQHALGLRQVVQADLPHAMEHSLEVQLPFLQRALDHFTLLPLAVGDASVDEVAGVLEAVWGGPETLIVISSDLSHFHAWRDARELDRKTIDTVLANDGFLNHQQACGATPLNGLLRVARRRGMQATLLDLCNSGDTAGDKGRVVGYTSLRFDEAAPIGEAAASDTAAGKATDHPRPALHGHPHPTSSPTADPALGAALLQIARQAIDARLSGVAADFLQASALPELDRPAATFVTLTKNGDLRGCIGSLEAHRPLRLDVEQNACAAAFRDPRFAPVSAQEWPQVRVEVSLLTAPQKLAVRDEAELRQRLRPGIDGVIFRAGNHRATFLPQVWEQLPTPEKFLAQLKQKAGLPADFWSPEVDIQCYQVQKWKAQ